MNRTLITLNFALTAGLALAGCRTDPARPAGASLYVFVDLSASIKPDQIPRWRAEARKLAARLSPGWRITLFGVHDQTLAAAPLFQAEILPLSPGAGIDETIACRRSTRLARKGAIDAFEHALVRAGRAKRTDLLSAIDRIDRGRCGLPAVVVFFSDMINSTAELNMEQGSPRPEKLIPSLASRHGWGPRTLNGVRVYCVLNGLRSGDPSAPDLHKRRTFYDTLFRALGGELALFDTHFDSHDNPLAIGGNNAGH